MTSEVTLKRWLVAIIKGNYRTALAHTQKTWVHNHGKTARERFEVLAALKIKRFKILHTDQENDVMQRHDVELVHKSGKSRIQLMSIRETGAYKPSESGTWGVNPASWRNVDHAA